MPHVLTKTDFIHYLNCPKSLWLLKRKPKVYPNREFTEFLQKIAREGYEVEKHAQSLFPDGMSASKSVLFQASAETDRLFARADILEQNEDGSYNLYEVKSSTRVKKDRKHNHYKDACFQMIAFEQAGFRIRDVFIIHLDPAYVLGETLDPRGLLKTVRVTDTVRAMRNETEVEIRSACALLAEDSIDETSCPCYRKTRSNRCDAFAYFNGEPKDRSVWELGRISEKKLCLLLDQDCLQLRDIPSDMELNPSQRLQVRSAMEGCPMIHSKKITDMLNTLVFPLHFLDYEAAMYAVPRVPGMCPWQQIPFQFSIHLLHEDGTLEHREHLSDSLHETNKLLKVLCDAVSRKGSVISWHASYEKKRNRDMAGWYPSYRDALDAINERMFDLEDIFKEGYVDAAFGGSTSIKRVLPVLCPHLSYADMEVRDGTQAMERWLAMAEGGEDAREDLLTYCKMDTFAMVELYRVLRNAVS